MITITYQDLGWFFLFCAIITVCVFLVILLVNVIKLTKRLNKLVEDNSENIKNALAVIPEVADNLNIASASVKDNLDKVGTIIDVVDEVVGETVVTVHEGTEKVLDIVRIAGDVIRAVINVFTLGKK